MSIICTKCGETNVYCKAMVNPNTKVFQDYTEESFYSGWCEDCKMRVCLTDTDEVKAEIDQEFVKFVAHHSKEPLYAICGIVWKDTNERENVKIQLSSDTNPDEDDDIFFYCNSVIDLKSLCEFGGEDFVVIEIYWFENK